MYPAIYRMSSYKEALIAICDSKKQAIGRNFTYQALAESCGMQKTYLSRVLRHDADLSDDQLFAVSEKLELDAETTDYLFLLWALNRTQHASRRQRLQKQVNEVHKLKTKTEGQVPLKAKDVAADDLKIYFLKPQFQVLHMLLTLGRFSGSLEQAAAHMNLAEDEITLFYNTMIKSGLIEIQKGKVRVSEDQLHLPESSPLFPIYRDAMRLMALKRVGDPGAAPYSFSAVFSCSEEARKEIHHSFLDWLKKVKSIVDKSPSKEVFQMNFDLLKWS